MTVDYVRQDISLIRSPANLLSYSSMIPIKPMLAVSGKAFSSDGWIFEPKIDGARCYGVIAYIFNNTVELKKKNSKMKVMS